MNEMPSRMTDVDDRTLVQQARAGSREAFAQIVEKHQFTVRATLWRMLGNGPDVDDVAQQVFLSLLQSISGFREQSSFPTWLTSITRNQAISFLRRRYSAPATVAGQLDQLLARRQIDSGAPARPAEPPELDALNYCLEQLNEPHRQLVRQIYFDGRRAADLARETGQPKNTVRMKLMRIRRALAKCMERNKTPG